jgi:hypothetical protein
VTPTVKFAFVAACLVVALISGVKCWNKRDWLWLVGALMFTVLSDSYLILQLEHSFGVATFSLAHVCYIFRAVDFKKYMLVPIGGFALVWGFALVFSSVIVLALLYGTLFAVNIFVTHFPKGYLLIVTTQYPKE